MPEGVLRGIRDMFNDNTATKEELAESIEAGENDSKIISDFEINMQSWKTQSVDIIDEKMREATEKIAIERERLLAMALHEGYDGVDIRTGTSVVTDYRDYSTGFEYEVWEDDPPTVDRWDSNVLRYDFRTLDDVEKRMLLARVGVDYYETE